MQRKIFYLLSLIFMLNGAACKMKKKEAVPTTAAQSVETVTSNTLRIYKLKKYDSELEWETRYSNQKIEGDLKFAGGEIHIDPQSNALLGGKLKLDMNSLELENMDNNPQGKAQLKNLLQHNLLSVEQYPEATLEISSVSKISNDVFKVNANLKLKETIKNIEFTMEIKKLTATELELESKDFFINAHDWMPSATTKGSEHLVEISLDIEGESI